MSFMHDVLFMHDFSFMHDVLLCTFQSQVTSPPASQSEAKTNHTPPAVEKVCRVTMVTVLINVVINTKLLLN